MAHESRASPLVAGSAAGVMAAAAAGLVDGLWSWSELSQFVPGFAGKVRVLVFLAACYGLAGALVGALAGIVLAGLWRKTRLGDVIRAGLARHQAARAANPAQALMGLSLAIAAVPCVTAALVLAYVYGAQALQARKHMGLIIAAAMGLAVMALVAGVLASFVVARPIEIGLRALAREARLGRVLSSPWAPLFAVLVLAAAGGLIVVIMAWDTLSLLHLRPVWIALVTALFALSTARLGLELARRLAVRRAWLRRTGPALGVAVLVLVMLAAGRPDGVRKAAGAYSGLGGPIARAARTVADLDRDGYSSVLGGGDCDDLRADVHPGAVEIPDDGVDQNCVGGDVSLRPSIEQLSFVPVPAAVPDDFNVVLITIDTVRADHVSAYGYPRPTTPHIDAVARDGALFRNAWAHAPSTRYSIPAILTGRYPLNVEYDFSIRGWPGLDEKNTTIAEYLKRAGLATGAILNYWYFDKYRRMDQGFDHYDNQNRSLHKQVPGQGPAQTKGSSSREQTDKAIEFIARQGARRFFLWVHYYDPHYEYEMHPGVPSFGTSAMDRYDHEIRFTDHHIGRLLDDLRARGLYQRTIIIITGDHGEGFGEHGIDMHGYHLYAAQTKVPLVVRVPGLGPVDVTTPVGHVDLLPTLANLAGLEPSSSMMGRSLVDIISGARDPDMNRYVFQQLSYEGNHEMRAAASKECHVIYNVSPDTSWELYRIDRDPLETRDVIDTADAPGPCGEARSTLEAWYDASEVPAGAAEALLAERPHVARPMVVDLGGEVRLLGVDLPDSPVKPGQRFDVTYTFEARGALAGDWRVFAHFEGPRGRRFQGDHKPPRPFAWWRAGQYIRYTHAVTVPQTAVPGTYVLWMGLFRKAERRPATSQNAEVVDDRARVGVVQVGG